MCQPRMAGQTGPGIGGQYADLDVNLDVNLGLAGGAAND